MIELSVVVPTYNRVTRLKQVFCGLERQNYPLEDFEVIVVSDGSTDDTHSYLSQLHTPINLIPVFQANQGPATARNTGIFAASGEYILFIDDDVVPSPDLVRTHIHTHQSRSEDLVVLGPMLTPTDYPMSPWVAWEQAMLYKQYRDMQQGRWQPTARQFYTGNTSLARKYLLLAGGFDTQFWRAEDVELAYRLTKFDLQFVFVPEAIGYHYAERSFNSWVSTPYVYGRNDVIFTYQKGQSWLLPTIYSEFHKRHRAIQRLVRYLLDKPYMSQWVINGLNVSAQLGMRSHIPQLSRMAYSCIFNLKYYQGITDQLGGRSQFLAGVDAYS